MKFPIEDKLLFIYRDYFEPSENKPIPANHPLIPKEHLGDFMELENFIVSFGRELNDDYPGEYRKSVLYSIMVHQFLSFRIVLAAIRLLKGSLDQS